MQVTLIDRDATGESIVAGEVEDVGGVLDDAATGTADLADDGLLMGTRDGERVTAEVDVAIHGEGLAGEIAPSLRGPGREILVENESRLASQVDARTGTAWADGQGVTVGGDRGRGGRRKGQTLDRHVRAEEGVVRRRGDGGGREDHVGSGPGHDRGGSAAESGDPVAGRRAVGSGPGGRRPGETAGPVGCRKGRRAGNNNGHGARTAEQVADGKVGVIEDEVERGRCRGIERAAATTLKQRVGVRAPERRNARDAEDVEPMGGVGDGCGTGDIDRRAGGRGTDGAADGRGAAGRDGQRAANFQLRIGTGVVIEVLTRSDGHAGGVAGAAEGIGAAGDERAVGDIGRTGGRVVASDVERAAGCEAGRALIAVVAGEEHLSRAVEGQVDPGPAANVRRDDQVWIRIGRTAVTYVEVPACGSKAEVAGNRRGVGLLGSGVTQVTAEGQGSGTRSDQGPSGRAGIDTATVDGHGRTTERKCADGGAASVEVEHRSLVGGNAGDRHIRSGGQRPGVP